jgi:hypothetical protein
MKQQRLSVLLLIAFCGLVLRFPAAQRAAAETPVPKAMPAATGAAGISPTPSPSPVPPSVRWVGVRNWQGEQRKAKKIFAQRGDKIWVDIINFDDWVNSLGDKKPDKHEWKNLILYLDHIPLPALPHFTHMNNQNRIIRRIPSPIKLGQLVFRSSAMTPRSPAGHTCSTNRSSTAS